MDGNNQFSMDGGNEGSGIDDYWDGDSKKVTREQVKELIDQHNSGAPFGSRMIPELPKEKFTEEITDYLQNSGMWLSNISGSVSDVLIRSGFKDRAGVEEIVRTLQQVLKLELESKMLTETQRIRQEMQPIFDMLNDPQLALSNRVKSFELK